MSPDEKKEKFPQETFVLPAILFRSRAFRPDVAAAYGAEATGLRRRNHLTAIPNPNSKLIAISEDGSGTEAAF